MKRTDDDVRFALDSIQTVRDDMSQVRRAVRPLVKRVVDLVVKEFAK